MSFMQPQVVFDEWWEVFTMSATVWIPANLIGDDPDPVMFKEYLEDEMEHGDAYEKITGYGARMSAPGYLDCTEWVVFDTEKEAQAYLQETYDVEN